MIRLARAISGHLWERTKRKGTMAGHSILYLGRGEFAADYLSELETLPFCALLTRSAELRVPEDAPSIIDFILIEAGPTTARSGKGIAELLSSLKEHPVIALTTRDREHRGIAAVSAGAQAYICVDDITVDGQESVFEHAIQRHRLQRRLSDTDVTVLTILRDINDGVIVVDQRGRVLDVNPAARTILGLGPRMQPDASWAQTFCCIDDKGENYRNSADLPLNRARNGEKFSDQVAIYRMPEQPDTMLSINGQGLYDGNRELVGGVITFRDITDVAKKTSELQKLAQFDELTSLPNRSLFTEQLARAIGRSQRKSAPLAELFIDRDRFKWVGSYSSGECLFCAFSFFKSTTR